MAPRMPWVLFGLAGASLLMVHTVLAAVAAGVLWAVLTWPLYRLARRRLGGRLAALSTLVLTGAAAVGLLALLGRLLVDDLRGVAAAQDDLLAALPAWAMPAQQKLVAVAAGLAPRLADAASRAVIQAPIAAFVAYVGLRQGWRIVLAIARALPLPRADAVVLLERAARTTRAVARGQLLTSAIKGAVGGIGLAVAGVPGAALLAVVMAVFTLLPILAAWMVWAPAALWLASQGHLVAAGFLAAWGVLIVGTVDNLVRPILVGRQARIQPAVALVGMAGGAATLGLPGLFLGPVLLDFTFALHDAWRGARQPGDAHPRPKPVPTTRPAARGRAPSSPVPLPVLTASVPSP